MMSLGGSGSPPSSSTSGAASAAEDEEEEEPGEERARLRGVIVRRCWAARARAGRECERPAGSHAGFY